MPKKRWTRRQFLETGSGTTVLVALIQPAVAAVFTPEERATLAAAVDEIIPAADGMPAATQAGALDYLERIIPQIPGLADRRAGAALRRRYLAAAQPMDLNRF